MIKTRGLGIRFAKAKNLVLLSSLAWRLLKNLTTPWGHLIMVKYATNKIVTTTCLILKSILKAWKVCNNGILWHPTINYRISIWYTNWIYNSKSFRISIKGPLRRKDLILSIGDLINNKEWNTKDIILICPVISLINLPLPPSLTSKGSKIDKTSWSLNSNIFLPPSLAINFYLRTIHLPSLLSGFGTSIAPINKVLPLAMHSQSYPLLSLSR